MQRGEYRKDTAIETMKGGGNNYQRGHFDTIFAIPPNCISFPNGLPTKKKEPRPRPERDDDRTITILSITMTPCCFTAFPFFLVYLFVAASSIGHALQQPVALLTGATGRTGQLVTNMLLDQGYHVRIFCRDESKAKKLFDEINPNPNPNIQYCQGDLGNPKDIESAFSSSSQPLTHVVFMAGGEGADYRCVNYQGVAAVCQQAVQCETIRQLVVISAAWNTRPYSIASLLFNGLYPDTVPMASHFLGEQALRQAVASAGNKLNYVILRAGGLNSDDNYAEKYPEAAKNNGLTYQQGDTFKFLGIAGRPGMSRSQLANAVVTAATKAPNGRYTVEVTGSGSTAWTDGSTYNNLKQDDQSSTCKEDELYAIHTQAVQQLKTTAIAASVGGIGLIGIFGFFPGLMLLVVLDAMILLVWSLFFATRQVASNTQ
jgi:uncharacterized protein YbjT (DUF2867 family)